MSRTPGPPRGFRQRRTKTESASRQASRLRPPARYGVGARTPAAPSTNQLIRTRESNAGRDRHRLSDRAASGACIHSDGRMRVARKARIDALLRAEDRELCSGDGVVHEHQDAPQAGRTGRSSRHGRTEGGARLRGGLGEATAGATWCARSAV